jgi:hypothetical protein
LHRAGLSFRHPVTGRALGFDPPPPDSFRAFLDTLEPVAALAVPATAVAAADATPTPEVAEPEPALRSPREILKRRAAVLPSPR